MGNRKCLSAAQNAYAVISRVKLCSRQVTAYMRFTIFLCQGSLDLWNYIMATLR